MAPQQKTRIYREIQTRSRHTTTITLYISTTYSRSKNVNKQIHVYPSPVASNHRSPKVHDHPPSTPPHNVRLPNRHQRDDPSPQLGQSLLKMVASNPLHLPLLHVSRDHKTQRNPKPEDYQLYCKLTCSSLPRLAEDAPSQLLTRPTTPYPS